MVQVNKTRAGSLWRVNHQRLSTGRGYTMQFLHQDTGPVADVAGRAVAACTDLKDGADARSAALADAVLGGISSALKGLPAAGQATVTAQVDERFVDGEHVVTKVYVDVTVVGEGKESPVLGAQADTDPVPQPALPHHVSGMPLPGQLD